MTGQATSEFSGVEYENEARAQGWRPKEEFSGNPELWVNAETYVKRGQEWAGPLKKEVERLRLSMRHLVESNQKQRDSLLKQYKEREEALTGTVAALTQQRDAAIAAADANGAAAAERSLAAATREIVQTRASATEVASTPAATDPEAVQAASEFKGRNREWYGTDQSATRDADFIGNLYSTMYPEKTLKEVLEQVESEVLRKYPQYNKAAGSKPQGPSSGPSSGVRSVSEPHSESASWDSLDAETRNIGAELIRRKVFKNREDYAKSLSQADVTINVEDFKKEGKK